MIAAWVLTVGVAICLMADPLRVHQMVFAGLAIGVCERPPWRGMAIGWLIALLLPAFDVTPRWPDRLISEFGNSLRMAGALIVAQGLLLGGVIELLARGRNCVFAGAALGCNVLFVYLEWFVLCLDWMGEGTQ
jgi:hypothetical protein